LAFVGYSAVKDAAVNKAQEETQKQIQTHLNKLKSLDVMDVSRSNNAPVDEVEAGDVKSEEQI